MSKKAVKRVKGKARGATYDVIWGDDLTANLEVASSFIWQKGFCVIKPNFGDDVIKSATAEASQLQRDSKMEAPPLEIVDGLLGSDGSSSIYALPLAEVGAETALQKLEKAIVSMGLDYVAQSNSLSVQSRSQAILHITAEPEEDEDRPELIDSEARGWLQVFMKQKLMLVYFMGPGEGSLELSLFNVEDTTPCTVNTEPGMLVLLRSDMMSHRHFSMRETKALSFFYMQESKSKMDDDGLTTTPTTDLLHKWVMNRLKEIKDEEAVEQSGAVETHGVPKDWISSANKYFSVGPQVAVRTCAARLPSTWKAPDTWYGMLAGCDFVEEVPATRWSIEAAYEDDKDSFLKFKSNSKHLTYCDGLDLFDAKFFSLSPAEVRSMDPQQRMVLELSYEALQAAGETKKSLMKSLIGVFLGASVQSEWGSADKGDDTSGAATTGGAASISSNRVSFCLGMQGPSYTADLGNSASLVVMTHAYNSQRYATKDYKPCRLALALGQYVSFALQGFLVMSAQGLFAKTGRCTTFDAGAAGYVKGEGFSSFVLQKYGEEVDGEIVVDEKSKLATMNAGVVAHQGHMASYGTPSGPVFQDMIASALRQAQLQPYDIDAIDLATGGIFMFDAVEALAVNNALRFEDSANALTISSAKTNLGMQHETCGMVQLMKNIYSQIAGVNVPNQHLVQLNPHIEGDTGLPIDIGTEMTPLMGVGSFMSANNFAVGGTVAHVITGAFKKETTPVEAQGQPLAPASIAFWPGGGGKLEEKMKPLEGYMIIGSWSAFNKTEPMIKESKDTFVFTVTLGVNGFEQFQIWLDGDSDKALHPSSVLGAVYTPLAGPVHADCCKGLYWMLGQAEGGSPGDQYLVRLRIAGKWRTVNWEKVGAAKVAPSDSGTYSIVGSWNNFGPQEMTSSGPGFHIAELVIPKVVGSTSFLIVRDGDCSQTFYPDGAEVAGPSDPPSLSSGWKLDAKAGDTFRITFKRNASKFEVKYDKVSEGAKVSPEEFKPEFGIVTLADTPKQYFKMEPIASSRRYSTTVKITDAIMFQILLNGDARQAYYPETQCATKDYPSQILGPDSTQGSGRGWLLKRDMDDISEEGGIYEISASFSPVNYYPTFVTWRRVG